MSYKERSIWVSLAILVYIWLNYFTDLVSLHITNTMTVDAVNGLLMTTVIQTIVLEIALQIVLAIIDHKDASSPEDERDKLITLHGSRAAYCILSVGVFLAIFYIVFPTLSTYIFPTIELSNTYKVMHLIILFAVIAEITKFSTQIFYYRRGF